MNLALRLFVKVVQTLFLLLALGVTFVFGMFVWLSKDGDENNISRRLPLANLGDSEISWFSAHQKEIPDLFKSLNALVVTNTDGFTDNIEMRLFVIETSKIPKLIEEISESYTDVSVNSDGNQYLFKALCLGQTDHNSWTINAELYRNYFEFCSIANDPGSREWRMIENDGHIEIHYFNNTQFFAVMSTVN